MMPMTDGVALHRATGEQIRASAVGPAFWAVMRLRRAKSYRLIGEAVARARACR